MKPKVIFEFAGGCMDGLTVVSDSPNPQEAHEADAHYFLTNNGTVGKRFMRPSPMLLEQAKEVGFDNLPEGRKQVHVYEVTDRLEAENEVLVRAKFVEERLGMGS